MKAKKKKSSFAVQVGFLSNPKDCLFAEAFLESNSAQHEGLKAFHLTGSVSFMPVCWGKWLLTL